MGSMGQSPDQGTKGSRRPINDSDITTLNSLLSSTPDHIITPSDPSYAATIKRWSAAAEKPAGASLVPTSERSISIAVKYANEEHLDLAVRGGGHSTAGVSSTSGGLLIDLSALNSVTVDVASKTVTAGGGANWGHVDEALAPHGLATVAGTVPDTGVGGLTLGGGYGWLTPKHGMVIDNLLSVTVVLASGEVVTASKTENTDLFWALRGAGQNFGVAVSFTYQAHDQGNVYAGQLVFPATPEIITQVVEIINDVFPSRPTTSDKSPSRGLAGAVYGFARPPPLGGMTALVIAMFHAGEKDAEAEGKEFFAPLLALQPYQLMSTLAVMPFIEANRIMQAPQGMRASMKGASFVGPVRPQFLLDVLGPYEEFCDRIAAAEGAESGASAVVFWEAIDPTLLVANGEKGSEAAGSFANRGTQYNAVIGPFWTRPENDTMCRGWARDVAQRFKAELKMAGAGTGNSQGDDEAVGARGKKGAVMVYGNYDQYEENSRDIFGSNYPRLQTIKATYDPLNTFDKLFAIMPAKEG